MIVSKYEGRYFSFEIISQSCIHSWNSNNKFVKMKFKFIQIREIKIRLERFFEKLYLNFREESLESRVNFFFSLAVKDE